MSQHRVEFTVPLRPVGKSDIEFTVYRDDEKFGVLRVSKGALDWIPGGKWESKPFRVTWSKFDELAQEHGRRMA
jgi:hypothetical protein